jgi:hypothetical protein
LNYKEILYFIATCLTISLEDKNRQVIKEQLQLETIDWDSVVKVSTAHYVFPALYCNLERANFLQYLPQELVSYMEYITNLNRQRNEQIIIQAEELNNYLLANSIKPIFLKGTGNLLSGLYKDIAERMVGDIDFIFSKEDYPKAITALIKNGYSFVDKTPFEHAFKHYARLKKEGRIAAIEIHKEILLRMYAKEFNYSFVEKDSQVIKGVTVLSYANKLNLSILSNQINDHGYYYKTMALRNAYDVFLLSKKTNAKDAVNALDKLNHPLNCFLAACNEVFNTVDSLEFHKTKKTAYYLTTFNSCLMGNERIKFYITLKYWLISIYKFIFHKDYRAWIFKRVLNKFCYK